MKTAEKYVENATPVLSDLADDLAADGELGKDGRPLFNVYYDAWLAVATREGLPLKESQKGAWKYASLRSGNWVA